MPYITPDDRQRLKEGSLPATAGELNYAFTVAALDYMKAKGTSYQTFNDIVGALEGAKLELYRRMVAGYEDQKMFRNGDVYTELV